MVLIWCFSILPEHSKCFIQQASLTPSHKCFPVIFYFHSQTFTWTLLEETGAARNQTSILLSCSTYWATIAHWHLQSLSLFVVPQTTLWTLMYWKRKPLAWPSVLRIGIILLWWYGVQICQFFHEWLWIERGFIKQGTQYLQLRKANMFHRSLPGKTTKRKKDNLWITASRF